MDLFTHKGLNDLGFLIETNNQGYCFAAGAHDIPSSDESINLYFTRTDSVFETGILIDNII